MNAMDWICTVAAIMATLAIIARVVLWTSRRSHQLASQRQSSTENPTELSKTGHGTELNDKAPSEVEGQSQKKM